MVLGLISILLLLFAPIIISILPSGPDISSIVSYLRLLFIYIPGILFIIGHNYVQ